MGHANPHEPGVAPDQVMVCPWCGNFYRGLAHCSRDGQPLEVTEGLIERYRIVDRLGEGGMGAVYKAEHRLLDDRIVALKLLHREHSRDKRLVQRFFREARAASRVDNDHIVSVIDFGTSADGDSFLVMEFLDGPSLRDVIDDEAPLDLARVFNIGVQIAEGLYAAHRKGIVHRDLKPENIQLIEREDEPEYVKLLDFGIALLSDFKDARITRAGMILGTPAYMAPEQASGQDIDHRADLYALGTIIYEALIGRCPFVGKTAKDVLVAQLTQQPTPPKELRPDIPTPVQEVVLRALEKDADRRPKTMLHLAYELRDALTRVTGTQPAIDDDMVAELEAARADGSTLSQGLAASAASLPPPVTADQLPDDELTMPVRLPDERRGLPLPMLIGIVVAGIAIGVVVTLLAVGGNGDGKGSGTAAMAAAATSGSGSGGGALAANSSSGSGSALAGSASGSGSPSASAGSGSGSAASAGTHRTRRRRHTRSAHRARRRAPSRRVSKPKAHRRASASHKVVIRSQPSGATVMDGRRTLGKTPLRVRTGGTARRLNLFVKGFNDKAVRLRADQTGTVTVRLKKQRMSWDVLSLGQLKRMRDAGQISRFTYQRRRRALLKRRDAKLMKLRVQCKLGHYSKSQCARQKKAITDSYR